MLTFDFKSSCSPLDIETCRGALFNQHILRCELMALVYIRNTVTWIQMRKECVVFLEQTVTSIYAPSQCSFTNGDDNYTQTKNSSEMPNNFFTIYIYHTDVLTYVSVQTFAYLRTAKIKTFRYVTLTHAAGCLGEGAAPPVKKFPAFITPFT